MNTHLRNTTQHKFPSQNWTWHKATHFAGRPCLDARINGTWAVLRVELDSRTGEFGWWTPNGTGASATVEQAKADAIADVTS